MAERYGWPGWLNQQAHFNHNAAQLCTTLTVFYTIAEFFPTKTNFPVGMHKAAPDGEGTLMTHS